MFIDANDCMRAVNLYMSVFVFMYVCLCLCACACSQECVSTPGCQEWLLSGSRLIIKAKPSAERQIEEREREETREP